MIKTVFDTQLAELGVPVAPRLYMENGRYVTGPFGWLVARCGVIKVRRQWGRLPRVSGSGAARMSAEVSQRSVESRR